MVRLRIVDEGEVGALRSQALWHGIPEAMAPDDPPVLSLCRPAGPYISIGFHRDLAEIDRAACAARGWPVVRRRIGGGPVYVDRDQLLFQLTLPAAAAPPAVDRLYRVALAPAVAAFRSLGLAAQIRGVNDISIGRRKLSGTGAGRIGDGVTVVGNIIFRFPHRRMVEALALPDDAARAECLRLMRRHVTSFEREGLGRVGFERARAALVEAYSEALGPAVATGLGEAERRAVDRWQERLAEPLWLERTWRPGGCGRRIKISADAWLFTGADGELAVRLSVAGGRIERLRLAVPGVNGAGRRLERALEGRRLEPADLEQLLAGFGEHGRRLGTLLTAAAGMH